ncbi:hypothetical protein Peur_065483 [Populus x canadensis]
MSKKRKTTAGSCPARAVVDTPTRSCPARAVVDTPTGSHEEVFQSRPLEVEDADMGSPSELRAPKTILSGSRTPQGCVTLFEPVRGVVVGGLVPALLDVVEAGPHAIQERCGSQTTYKVCNPREMWVPNCKHRYVTRLDKHHEPDKIVPVFLLPTEKARQKEGRGH